MLYSDSSLWLLELSAAPYRFLFIYFFFKTNITFKAANSQVPVGQEL